MVQYGELVTVPCILCGEDNNHIVSRKTDRGRPVSISVCRNDGLVFQNPRWCPEMYREFYSGEYDERYRPPECSTQSPARRAYVSRIWPKLEGQALRDGDAVLDIGAGMGWTLEFLGQRFNGHLAFAAVEASEPCVGHLESLGVELLARDADAQWHVGNKERFSLVILRHALEHFLQPIEVLLKASYVLSPQGVIYIEVPDMMSPKGPLDRHWFGATHTYYFCKETLVCAAERAHLKPLRVESEDSTVLALFGRADPSSRCTFQSVYERQVAMIEAYRRRRAVRDVVSFWYKAITSRIPKSLKAQVPYAWKKTLIRYLF